jgi:hypothetical protein
MVYTCEFCNKPFKQKSHLNTHINKKFSCKKCDNTFITQHAYVNNEIIHINDYKKTLHHKPRCKNGHELIFCPTGKNNRRKYFRHKNKGDLNNNPKMTEWHYKLQGFFPNTEVAFIKNTDKQIENRKADVLLNDKYILEVQHSRIEEREIMNRTHDYKLHDKELIWIVDGNTKDVRLDKLSDGTYLIEFNNNWKYYSFNNYEFILLDIDEHIFKIPVKSVCNKMIHVKEYIKIDDVVNELKNNPENIWNLWKDINEINPILRIKQQGAGNGKTYGIWKDISVNFDKKLYIITTKQHTAKNVILGELDKQAKRKDFHIVDNMEELEYDDMEELEDNNIEDKKYKRRQYIVTYKHIHSSRTCIVIIGTIDSFIYNLTSKSIGGNSYFEGLLKNICVNGCDKITNTGQINYGGKQIKLNKMTELCIDETQDLSIDYYKAILKLILNTKIDVVIVGDKLQSLKYEHNFMTHIEDNDAIKIIREEPKNINRRIKVKNMANEINKLVRYKDYDVPEIHIENSEELEDRGNNVIEYFEQKCIYANDTNKKKINNEVNKIIEKVEHEVNLYNYKPEDFLFIFPIMENNVLAGELETKLNNFWLKKLGNDDVYKQYAVLHKHEEGQIIDTTRSKEATRIMSIAASKGDGRAVVFVLNCTEQSLKLVSNNEINIVYESHFNVSLTRAIYKIYFGLQYNNDDIHKRISGINDNIEYIPYIKPSFTIDMITQYIDKDDCIKLLENNKIYDKVEQENDNTISKIIDWEYHCIRRAIYYNYALFVIFKHNEGVKTFEKSQIKVVLDKIARLPIRKHTPNDFYTYLKAFSNDDLRFDDLRLFPLCDISHKKIYERYYNKINKIIINIQKQYNESNLSIGNLSPKESSILIYLIDVFMNKIHHNYTPTTIYNIIHSFEQNNDLEKLLDESIKMKHIMENLMENALKNKNINWNIEHYIKFNGNTNELKLYNNFNLIGHNEKNVYHLIFQTDYNKLNYCDTMIKVLLERFLIRNANSNEHETNNQTRYSGKKITTYLLILKQNKYEIFDWEFENNIDNELKIICKTALIKYFKNYNKDLFNYCKFIKDDKSNPNKWTGYKSPYQFLAKKKEFEKKSYIINFFNNLHEECKTRCEKKIKEVKKITDNFNLFEEKLNEYIIDMIDTYFGFNITNDELEW